MTGLRGAVAPQTAFWRLAVLGLIAGLLSGLFGVGGGILIVPALVLIGGFEQKLSHGTSLAAVVPISIVGAATYLIGGYTDLLLAGLLTVGAVLGALVGARLLHGISEKWLRWLFIAFMAAVAVRLFFEVPSRETALQYTVWIVIVLLALGLVTGILSGLLGVGGGVFMVPVMIVFIGVGDLTAKGVSLLVVIPTGIIATILSVRNGHVDLRAAGIVGVAGAGTAAAGAALAWLLPPRLSAVLFAVFLLLVAIRMAVRALRSQSKLAAPERKEEERDRAQSDTGA
ncbi:MAG: sulfite exporter TauE/SafE family protein [Nakamurella sp.]